MSNRERAIAALQDASAAIDYVWDGRDEDERPLSPKEMRAGHTAYKRLGRPPGSSKVSTTIRFDEDVLQAFRSEGPGWQSRMNAALREWMETHPTRG